MDAGDLCSVLAFACLGLALVGSALSALLEVAFGLLDRRTR